MINGLTTLQAEEYIMEHNGNEIANTRNLPRTMIGVRKFIHVVGYFILSLYYR